MSERLAVHAGDVQHHAAEVGDIAGRLSEAADAAQPMASGAYGVVGQMFFAHLSDADAKTSSTVGKLARDVTDHQRALDDTVKSYQSHDRRTADCLNGLDPGGPLPGSRIAARAEDGR